MADNWALQSVASAGAALCIGAEAAVQTAAGAGPATRVVHRAAVFPSQAEKTGCMSDPVGMVLLDRLSYLLEFGY